MPTEDRFIVFNYEEVYMALRIRAITQKLELPADSALIDVSFPDNPTVDDIVSVTLKKDDGSTEKIDFSRDFFAMALVFFCQGNNIPIPRAGSKEIIRKDNTLILHIQMKQ